MQFAAYEDAAIPAEPLLTHKEHLGTYIWDKLSLIKFPHGARKFKDGEQRALVQEYRYGC